MEHEKPLLVVTQHAAERTRERLGIPKKSAEANAQKALEYGLRHNQVKGSLSRYFDSLYFKYQVANNIRVYGEYVYIFTGTKLITILPLPNKYRKTVREIRSKEKRG